MTLRRKLDCYRSCTSQHEARTFSSASLCHSRFTARSESSLQSSGLITKLSLRMLSNLSLLLKPLLPRPLNQSHRRKMLSFCTILQPLFFQRLISLLPVMYKPNLMYFMTLLYDSLITFIRSIPSQLHLGTPTTPHIKAKLRKKNRLMRAGQTEKASALALRISKDIANRNQTRL